MEIQQTDVMVAPAGAPVAASARRAGRWREIGRALEIWIPASVIVAVLALCYLWPWIGGLPSPIDGNVINANLPLGAAGHPLGTDSVGNDVFSRICYGGRVSLEVGFAVTAIGMFGGGALGTIAAYNGGWLDAIIMRILDVLIAFPSLVLALAIAEYLGPGELHVIYAISFFSVPSFARLARAATLRVREQGFVLAGRLSGTRTLHILTGHIAPNVLPQLVTFAFLGMSVTIIIEASLSFLGLGVRPPNPSWGDMISDGQQYLSSNANLVLLPSAFLLVTVVALNLLGDGLRARWASK